jgi:uncharacterized protein with von Willebrand factor type A (vWA) domain
MAVDDQCRLRQHVEEAAELADHGVEPQVGLVEFLRLRLQLDLMDLQALQQLVAADLARLHQLLGRLGLPGPQRLQRPARALRHRDRIDGAHAEPPAACPTRRVGSTQPVRL